MDVKYMLGELQDSAPGDGEFYVKEISKVIADLEEKLKLEKDEVAKLGHKGVALQNERDDLKKERERILKGFHDPKEHRCGACEGLLEDTRDAICYRCSPEPEVQQLMDTLSRAEEKIEALESKPAHVVNNPPLMGGKEHPLFPTIKSEFSDAICQGVNAGKAIGMMHEHTLNRHSNEHADKVVKEIRERYEEPKGEPSEC